MKKVYFSYLSCAYKAIRETRSEQWGSTAILYLDSAVFNCFCKNLWTLNTQFFNLSIIGNPRSILLKHFEKHFIERLGIFEIVAMTFLAKTCQFLGSLEYEDGKSIHFFILLLPRQWFCCQLISSVPMLISFDCPTSLQRKQRSQWKYFGCCIIHPWWNAQSGF